MVAKKNSKGATPSKADFVRAQPASLSAKEIVEKAKAENIKLSETYIYKVRSKKKSKQKTSAPKAAKKHARKGGRKARKGTKSAFVLGLPRDLSAAEVVERGKAAGVALSIKHVYTIRSANRTKGGGGHAKPGRPVGSKTRHAVPSVIKHDHGVEGQFMRLALAVGTSRAADLLRRLDSKIAHLVLD